jgi:hypothetical protein
VVRRGRAALATTAEAVAAEPQPPKQQKKQQKKQQQQPRGQGKKGEAKVITPMSEDFSRCGGGR